MIELCNYDAVILLNIDMANLPEGYDGLLHDYVEIQGRSLLLCGGGSTFMYGNMVGTAVESIMPVDFTVPEQSKGDSVAIMILLDYLYHYTPLLSFLQHTNDKFISA